MISLITDRTFADVAFALANKASLIPLKGAYNYTDYNRVSEAVNELSELIALYGYKPVERLKTDWKRDDVFYLRDAEKYLAIVHELMYNYGINPSLPNSIQALASTDGHERANDIEKALVYLEMLVSNMISAFQYGGTFYGGDHLYLLRGWNI